MKRRLCSILALALLVAIIPLLASGQGKKIIRAEEASNYLRQSMMVCGKVVDTEYLVRGRGQPTFLNLNRPYPNHIFTIVIFGSERDSFEKPPETFYDGKDVCVSGLIVEHKGKPQMVVKNPSQITIK
jgi:micrococcal nuclease